MKKLFYIFGFVILCMFIFACYNLVSEKNPEDPSGYPVDKSEFKPTGEPNVMLYNDNIIPEWYEEISYEKYQALELVMAQDKWKETASIKFDENDAPIVIRISYANGKMKNFFFFPDETVIKSGITYQMPKGTYEKIDVYIQNYYKQQHDKVTDTVTFLPQLFDSEYEIHWLKHYDPPKFKRNETWIPMDFMMCNGTSLMAEEMLKAFGDTSQWEEIPVKMPSMMSDPERKYVGFTKGNKYESTYNVNIQPQPDGKSYISINTYAAFVSSNNVYARVMKVLKDHEDEWQVVIMEE